MSPTKIVLVILSFFLLSTTVAIGHSWYPIECCSGYDCFPIPCEEIHKTAKGWLYNGTEYTGTMIKTSQDALCHACPRCLFLPLGV